ncbi:hypothetical protein EB796_017513 [Bugula neritina]|uniref:ADAP1 n=1 Tax=Bugula neritina TaxID=10212 RepID=A0A7J7JD39_BUGNE|nr:hypothetical protein EB796_017513 [Bugula neritina]
MSGGNHRRLLDIRLKPGNDNRCADCNAEEPEWASYSIGVFLCATCCGIHRSLGTHISKTKGIKLDNWDDEQVAAKSPKAKLPVDKLNCCFVPSKIGNLNGMQISYPDQRGHTRNIYVFSSDGKDIVDWYMAIRNVKLTRLRIGLPHVEESELVQRLTSDFILEGWLYKTGPDLKDAWKRRWFTFDRRKLLYFDEPLGAYAKGEIFLGEAGNDCSVYHGLPNGRTPCGVPFTLRVPAREYPLAAECEEEREQWMTAIKTVLATPLSLQEQAEARAWTCKR